MADHHGMHEPQPIFDLEGSNWQEDFHKGVQAYLQRWVTEQALLSKIEGADWGEINDGIGSITGVDDYGYKAERVVTVADLDTGSIAAGASNKEVHEPVSLPFPEEPNATIDDTLPLGAFRRTLRMISRPNGETEIVKHYYMNPPSIASLTNKPAPR